MLTLASPVLLARMLWALLLLDASFSAQKGSWDNPTCTQGVVSVPRGARAMMACNISNPFSNITICLSVAARTDCQYIFRNAPQGNTSQDGWHLRVQGGMAQLVIEDAWDNQSGQYKWHLQGGQINVGITTLNVSGPESPRPLHEVGSQSDMVFVIPVIVILFILVLGMWAWCRRRHSLKLSNIPQLADTGIYTCQAIMENIREIQGPGTSVVVTDKLSQAVNTCREAQLIHPALPTALAVGFFLIGLGLGAVCVLRRTQIKKLCWASDKNSVCVVYEDMSYSRRNTVSTPNPYQ
ncbi:secreted and transmembrane protein 1A isoform X2 [Equus przewalskii]|uniref:Secreted and transmembrane protein 1A isoform X2 n=1 Tax=Equus przewalskii TaxID=9798 RepID=A0ABM4JIE2_EQUPR